MHTKSRTQSMNTLPSLDKFLSSPSVDPLDIAISEGDKLEDIPVIVELAEGETDPRLKLLSHSSRVLLHTCPRKYQLYRLSATETALAD